VQLKSHARFGEGKICKGSRYSTSNFTGFWDYFPCVFSSQREERCVWAIRDDTCYN